MLGSVVLDVALGLAFLFLLLSLIASTVHEFLASLVQARAANLQRGLASLFSGGKLADGCSFVDGIYNHGLVLGLYRDDRRDFGLPLSPVTPCAAPPAKAMRRSLLEWLMRVQPVAAIRGVENRKTLPAYIPARTFALALIDLLNVDPLNKERRSGPQATVSIRATLVALQVADPHNKAAEALLALATHAGDNLSTLQTSIEQWYNDAMDRVSGWYKNRAQLTLLWIGLALAVGFNVNSIQVAETLWFDRDVRASMVEAAGKVQAPTPAVSLGAQLQQQVAAWESTSEGRLPVGWKHVPSFRLAGPTAEATRERLLRLASIAGGWAITAFAISLGAAFWFDTLNKFMVVRNTVKPQEKSRDEGSKDAE